MNSMHNPIQDIAEFQEKILQNQQPVKAGFIDPEKMRHNLLCLNEEVMECVEAYYDSDQAGVVDAIIDLMYFAYGFLWQMGVPTDRVWEAVHKANMTKVRGKTKRGVDYDAAKPDIWADPKDIIKEILNGKT